MSRPIKDPAAVLSYRLNVRLTNAEGQQVEADAAAAGLTVSDHAAQKLSVRTKPRRPKTDPVRQTLIRHLGQLGNIRADINQLLKDRQAHLYVQPDRADAALKSLTTLADLILSELPGDGD